MNLHLGVTLKYLNCVLYFYNDPLHMKQLLVTDRRPITELAMS